MWYIVIFNRLAGISNVALLVRSMVHVLHDVYYMHYMNCMHSHVMNVLNMFPKISLSCFDYNVHTRTLVFKIDFHEKSWYLNEEENSHSFWITSQLAFTNFFTIVTIKASTLLFAVHKTKVVGIANYLEKNLPSEWNIWMIYWNKCFR